MLGLVAPERARVSVDELPLHEVITRIRNLPSPQGKKSHSLTEISRIAGASKGWTESVLRMGGGHKTNRKSEDYARNLRKYLKRAMGEHHEAPDVSDVLGIRRRSREEVEQRAQQPAPVLPAVPRIRRPSDDVPIAPLPRPKTTEIIAPNGARIIQSVPLEPAPISQAESPNFYEQYAEIKKDLWLFSERMDNLEKIAPVLFKPAVGQFRDELLGLLQKLEG